MKSININEIVEAAQLIAKEKSVNLFFSVRGNIIEGCRNRKTSEEFEFDVEKEEAIYDTTRDEIATAIIKEAVGSLKENEETEDIDYTKIKVPEDLLDAEGLFKWYNDDIEIEDEEYCTFTSRCGAYDDKFNLYILEDKFLRKIDVEETDENRYGKFYWFNNHTQAVVVEENGDVGLVQCRSLDEYVEDYTETYYDHFKYFDPDALLSCSDNIKKAVKVPEKYLDTCNRFDEANAEIIIKKERYFTFADRCGARGNNSIYILEDKVLRKIDVEEASKNLYGTFYWFNNHTQTVVVEENGDTEVFECSSLADYVERYRNDECFNY